MAIFSVKYWDWVKVFLYISEIQGQLLGIDWLTELASPIHEVAVFLKFALEIFIFYLEFPLNKKKVIFIVHKFRHDLNIWLLLYEIFLDFSQ